MNIVLKSLLTLSLNKLMHFWFIYASGKCTETNISRARNTK